MGSLGSLQCHMTHEDCTGSHDVLQWSLSGSMGSYGILQSHVRGCTDSPGAVQ